MRLRPIPMPVVLIGSLALELLDAGHCHARAQAAAPPPPESPPAAPEPPPPRSALRAVVRLTGPVPSPAGSDDQALIERLQGQTVDLDVVLIPEPGQPLEPTLRAQLQAASELAQRHTARAVVWMRTGPSGRRTVYVAEPAASRVFARPLRGVGSDATARSAALEEFAVVVRSALRALAQGDSIGIANAVAEAEEPPPQPPPPPPPPPTQIGLLLGLGWQLALDGAGSFGQTGPILRGGLSRGRFTFALTLAAAIPAGLTDAFSTVRLSRHSAAALASFALVSTPRWRLELGAQVGLALFYRSTEAVQAGYTPTPGHVTPAFLGGPALDILARPVRSWRLWLALELGADALAGAPELGYQAGAAFVSRNQLWPVAPRFAVAALFRSR